MNQTLTDILGLFGRKDKVTNVQDRDVFVLGRKSASSGIGKPKEKAVLIEAKDFVTNYVVPKVTVSGDIHVDDVYSEKLYTDIAAPAAKITGYSTTSSAVTYNISFINTYSNTTVSLSDMSSGLPELSSGVIIKLFTNGTNAEVVIQVGTVNSSSPSFFSASYSLISGVETQNNYQSKFEINVVNTQIDVDTDLTAIGITAGSSIILGGVVYEVTASTQTSVTVQGSVANIDKIDEVGVGNKYGSNPVVNFDMLSYKATLTDGTVVEKTPVLSNNIVTNRITLNTGGLEFPESLTDNQFIGYNSGLNITSGTKNTSLGQDALSSVDVGNNNIGIGPDALINVTNAQGCIGIGFRTLSNNSSDQYNIAIGDSSASALSGARNVVLGAFSGGSISGDNNIAIGTQTANSIQGDNNVMIGYKAVYTTTNGPASNNTVLGANAEIGNLNNGCIILGHMATASGFGSNQFVVGSTTTNAGSVVTETNTSSKVWNVVINGVAHKILLA